VVILSCDEFQHINYEVVCDVARMSKVVCSIRQAEDMRPILWLRFNPDTFHVNGEATRVGIDERATTLADMINNSQTYLGNREVALYYLYYDVVQTASGDTTLEISYHPDYSHRWKDVIAGCVVN